MRVNTDTETSRTFYFSYLQGKNTHKIVSHEYSCCLRTQQVQCCLVGSISKRTVFARLQQNFRTLDQNPIYSNFLMDNFSLSHGCFALYILPLFAAVSFPLSFRQALIGSKKERGTSKLLFTNDNDALPSRQFPIIGMCKAHHDPFRFHFLNCSLTLADLPRRSFIFLSGF